MLQRLCHEKGSAIEAVALLTKLHVSSRRYREAHEAGWYLAQMVLRITPSTTSCLLGGRPSGKSLCCGKLSFDRFVCSKGYKRCCMG